ncbi:MAG TPA: ERCC4 domain-containing protein [archaeon]|nr:ERCC4 domain-containing protein [archaeon]
MQENEVIIYADHRDNTRIKELLKKLCKVEEKQLEVADYLLSESVAAERKTTDDFLNSLTDGRLFKQLAELKKNFVSPLLIIEGDTLFGIRKIHPNAIRGALASIAIDYAMPVIWTASQLETAQMLFSIAKREQLDSKKSVAIRGKRSFRSDNQEQLFLISGLPGISTEKAKSLLKHFGSPEKVFLASEAELQQADGIGRELAKRIRLILSKKYEKSILED